MFNTSGMTAPVASGSKFLSAGINEDVTVAGFQAGESASGTPFLEVELRKGDDSSKKDKLYFSEKAQPSSLQRILHLLVDGAGMDRTVFDSAGEGAASLNDYANKLNMVLPKKSFRLKLNGEEYTKDGSVKVASRIPFQNFAEPTATSPSMLTYDEKNKNDYKVAVQPDAMPDSMSNGKDDKPDLPF